MGCYYMEKPYKESKKRISINDVARHAGVSRSTVSLVMNSSDLISEATKRKVEQAIVETGYVYPRFYVSTSKSIIKALINMRSFEIQLSPIG